MVSDGTLEKIKYYLMRKRTIALFVGVLGFIVFMLMLVSFFRYNVQIFDEPEFEKLATVCTQYDEVCYKCFYVPSNATSQEYIQLRRSIGGRDSVIANYERYDLVDTIQLIDESTISLVLEDTSAYLKRKDTIIVKSKH
ncbi:hypothetical protein GCM10027299_18830 [Larkinella ripae]